MKTIGLLYSKSTAYTAELGERIAAAWGKGIEYVDIDTAHLADVEKHAALILGTPTYFNGELPSAWDEFLPEIEDADFTGKRVAIYGPGNQVETPVLLASGGGVLPRGATPLPVFIAQPHALPPPTDTTTLLPRT